MKSMRHRDEQIPALESADPKYVDRSVQEDEFSEFFTRASKERPGSPQIYLLPGLDVDCSNYFVDRLREDELERLAPSFRAASKAAVDRVEIQEPPSYGDIEAVQKHLGRELFTEFQALQSWDYQHQSAAPLAQLDSFNMPAFLLIEQTIRVDRAASILKQLMAWHWEQLWANITTRSNVLIFIHLIFPMPPRAKFLRGWIDDYRYHPKQVYRGLEEELAKILTSRVSIPSKEFGSAPVIRLSTLAPIEPSDITTWLRPFALPNVIPTVVDRLLDQASRQSGRRRHLSYLYQILDDYFQDSLGTSSQSLLEPVWHERS